jgi:(R,R)-butanediol dehydrogenase/meso-butanediol dehydrogenase/diacetyl reductase
LKAAVFQGLGQPFTIEEVPTPQAGAGEIVLRVDYCGICGSDLHATQEGVFLVPNGTVLGHEFAGEVVESGSTAWKAGDRVTAVPNNACSDCVGAGFGRCKDELGIMCPKNLITGFGLQFPGAYAQYVKVRAEEALHLPAAVGSREGATVEPLAVGLHAVEKGKVALGERVLILGAGPIGLAVAIFAKLAGARDVIVSEYAPARRAAAAALGATAIIDPNVEEDVGAAFAREAHGPPDVIFDCVGVPGVIQKCIDLAKTFGRVVVVGVCMVEDRLIPLSGTFKEINIQFVLGYVSRNWRLVLDLLDAGRIDPRPMITDTVTLADLPQAFEALRKPTTQIKVLIAPN